MNFNNLNYCIDEPLILELNALFPLVLFFFLARENISEMLTGITTTMELLKFYLVGHSGKEVSFTLSLVLINLNITIKILKLWVFFSFCGRRGLAQN